jgi:hypothetical protein
MRAATSSEQAVGPNDSSAPMRTAPRRSLIPQCITIRRATSVARWMSFSAPLVTSP